MARGGVHPDWIREKKEEIRKGEFVSITLSYNPAAQWLIVYLDSKNIPCNVINLGAGVKKITIAEKVCPHCGGEGYLK